MDANCRSPLRYALLAAIPTLGLWGCAGPPLRGLGPEADRVALVEDGFRSATGCQVGARLYRPARPRTQVLVVLAHGFMRDGSRMADLARRIAENGVPAVALSLCASAPWSGAHMANAMAMRRAAERLGARRVIYAGFSAGGLSALLAARGDPRAVGVLTLDLVDDGGLGADAASGIRVPILGLEGDPSPCNADNNGRAAFAASHGGRLLPIPGASHCDFESPTDWLCTALCGTGAPAAGTAARRERILRDSTAAVLALAGLSRGRTPYGF